MAADSNPHHQPNGMDSHRSTYDAFITGSMALTMLCLFTMVALVAFRFMPNLNVLTGFCGLIVGIIATIIDIRVGGKWLLTGGLLVLFGLFVAMNI